MDHTKNATVSITVEARDAGMRHANGLGISLSSLVEKLLRAECNLPPLPPTPPKKRAKYRRPLTASTDSPDQVDSPSICRKESCPEDGIHEEHP